MIESASEAMDRFLAMSKEEQEALQDTDECRIGAILALTMQGEHVAQKARTMGDQMLEVVQLAVQHLTALRSAGIALYAADDEFDRAAAKADWAHAVMAADGDMLAMEARISEWMAEREAEDADDPVE